MKRILLIIVTLSLLHETALSQLEVYVVHSEIKINDVFYNLKSDGTAEVTNQKRCPTCDEYEFKDDTYEGIVVIQPSVLYQGVSYKVTEIGNYAFHGCKRLRSVNIPYSIMAIGTSAFSYCYNLETLTLPDNLKSIGARAFMASGLSSIIIPNSVTTIEGFAFAECQYLTNINIPDNVDSLGIGAFIQSGITHPVYNSHIFAHLPSSYSGEYAIPYGIEIITGNAFVSCKNLTGVTIPNSVRIIGQHAFGDGHNMGYGGCQNLSSIIIPNSVTYIGYEAFIDCKNLNDVVIGNGVKTIESAAFKNCINLSKLQLGNNIRTIGHGAFDGCKSLTYITVPNSVTKIGNDAFRGLSYIIYSGAASGAPWGARAVCQ